MERVTLKRPGYDCKFAACQHTPKGDHGIHGGSWWFVVKDGDVALSLEVMHTFDFPPTVPASTVEVLRGIGRHGGNTAGPLCLHAGFRVQGNDDERPCEWVAGGKCYGVHAGYLAGDEFWTQHGNDAGPEQTDAFWGALEAKLREWAGELRDRSGLTAGEEI